MLIVKLAYDMEPLQYLATEAPNRPPQASRNITSDYYLKS